MSLVLSNSFTRLGIAPRITYASLQSGFVVEEGIEPSRPFGHWDLNPARLPNSAIRPSAAIINHLYPTAK